MGQQFVQFYLMVQKYIAPTVGIQEQLKLQLTCHLIRQTPQQEKVNFTL